jgi:hypothetical protein
MTDPGCVMRMIVFSSAEGDASVDVFELDPVHPFEGIGLFEGLGRGPGGGREKDEAGGEKGGSAKRSHTFSLLQRRNRKEKVHARETRRRPRGASSDRGLSPLRATRQAS